MTTETNLWEWLRDVVLPLGQYSRIETGDTCSGFPDVHCQLGPGVSLTIELKCARRPNARYPFTSKRGMRTSQIRWIRENLRQGGVVWILAEVSPYVYVIEGKYANDINGRSHSYLRKIAHKVLKRGQNEDAAQILHEILLGEKTRFT